MAILYNKTNAFYLIAGSLAALTLLSSIVLAVVSSVPIFLALTLAILSALVIRFSYKIINDHTEINKLVKENKDLASVKQQLEAERVNVINAERKIQDQGTELSAVKKEMQEQKLVKEKKIQELKVLEDKVRHKEAEPANTQKRIKELEDKVKHEETELTSVKKELQELENTVKCGGIELDERKKRIKELEDKIKHQETELDTAKKEIQDQKADVESKIKALRGLEDIIKQQETDLNEKESNIEKLRSIINGNEVENDQKQPVRGRSNSLPSSSLLSSTRASGSTNSLPEL